MTKVINKRFANDLSGLPSSNHVYIGRPTKWGNKFTHISGDRLRQAQREDGLIVVASREEAVCRYEEWIRTQPDLVAAAKRELRGKVLVCWCAPLACHGDVLARIAEEP